MGRVNAAVRQRAELGVGGAWLWDWPTPQRAREKEAPSLTHCSSQLTLGASFSLGTSLTLLEGKKWKAKGFPEPAGDGSVWPHS